MIVFMSDVQYRRIESNGKIYFRIIQTHLLVKFGRFKGYRLQQNLQHKSKWSHQHVTISAVNLVACVTQDGVLTFVKAFEWIETIK